MRRIFALLLLVALSNAAAEVGPAAPSESPELAELKADLKASIQQKLEDRVAKAQADLAEWTAALSNVAENITAVAGDVADALEADLAVEEAKWADRWAKWDAWKEEWDAKKAVWAKDKADKKAAFDKAQADIAAAWDKKKEDLSGKWKTWLDDWKGSFKTKVDKTLTDGVELWLEKELDKELKEQATAAARGAPLTFPFDEDELQLPWFKESKKEKKEKSKFPWVKSPFVKPSPFQFGFGKDGKTGEVAVFPWQKTEAEADDTPSFPWLKKDKADAGFEFPWAKKEKKPAKGGKGGFKFPWQKEDAEVAEVAEKPAFEWPWAKKDEAAEVEKPAFEWPWAKKEKPAEPETSFKFPWQKDDKADAKEGFKFPWEKEDKAPKKPTFPWDDPDFVFPWDVEEKEVKKSPALEKKEEKVKPQKRATTLLDRLNGTSSWETMAWVLLVLSLILSAGLIVAIYFQIQQRRRYDRIDGTDNGSFFTPAYGNTAERAPFASSATAPRYNDEKPPLQEVEGRRSRTETVSLGAPAVLTGTPQATD